MNLEELMEQVTELQKIAEFDLEHCDYRTRAGMTIAVKEAKESIEKLRVQYGNYISQNNVGIFILGPKTADFISILKQELSSPAVFIDSNDVYRELAIPIYETLGSSREFGSLHYNRLINSMLDVVRGIGNDVPAHIPKFMDSGVLTTLEDTVDFIKRIVRNSFNDDFNVFYMKNKIIGSAFDLRYTSSMMPVVIYGLQEDEFDALSKITAKMGLKVVTTDKEITKEIVIETFDKLKKKMKKNPNPENDLN